MYFQLPDHDREDSLFNVQHNTYCLNTFGQTTCFAKTVLCEHSSYLILFLFMYCCRLKLLPLRGRRTRKCCCRHRRTKWSSHGRRRRKENHISASKSIVSVIFCLFFRSHKCHSWCLCSSVGALLCSSFCNVFKEYLSICFFLLGVADGRDVLFFSCVGRPILW